jgi:hypothetical protein
VPELKGERGTFILSSTRLTFETQIKSSPAESIVPFSAITYSSVSLLCRLITIKMTDQLILPSTPAAGVRVLALNRPSKRNALSQDLITVFLEHLHSASNDDGVRVIVITGSTTFFCGMKYPSPLYRQGQGGPALVTQTS